MDGVLVVDKPTGKTSHDVVNRIRRIASQKKVGHTGTLDPMATGVLVILLGKATRIGRFLDLEPKIYIADAIFGLTTDTQDITGNITQKRSGMVERTAIEQILPEFLGEIEQIPPMVSAIKMGGQTLYKLARKGIEIEREPRKITIHELDLLEHNIIDHIPSVSSTTLANNNISSSNTSITDTDETLVTGGISKNQVFSMEHGTQEDRTQITLRVKCSGGTYVRTLIHDVGLRLEIGATLSGLRRTGVGGFSIKDAVSLNDLINGEPIHDHLISMNDALHNLPLWIVNDDSIRLLLYGRELDENAFQSARFDQAMQSDRIEQIKESDSPIRLTTADGTLLGIGYLKQFNNHTKQVIVKPEIVLKEI